MSHADVVRILALPVEERSRLLELIRESLSMHDSEVPLSDAHRRILDERLARRKRS